VTRFQFRPVLSICAPEALGKQADALSDKLGPEYNDLMDGFDELDPNSNEGKELDSILSKLDDLCPE
jgi:hypothetical protein